MTKLVGHDCGLNSIYAACVAGRIGHLKEVLLAFQRLQMRR